MAVNRLGFRRTADSLRDRCGPELNLEVARILPPRPVDDRIHPRGDSLIERPRNLLDDALERSEDSGGWEVAEKTHEDFDRFGRFPLAAEKGRAFEPTKRGQRRILLVKPFCRCYEAEFLGNLGPRQKPVDVFLPHPLVGKQTLHDLLDAGLVSLGNRQFQLESPQDGRILVPHTGPVHPLSRGEKITVIDEPIDKEGPQGRRGVIGERDVEEDLPGLLPVLKASLKSSLRETLIDGERTPLGKGCEKIDGLHPVGGLAP